MSYDMYKRRREIEGHNEAESELSGLANGPMREPGAQKERGSSGSWQPRMYECQYCKRGFTSAQALGGHMNVHRRDRAMGKDGFNGSPASNHRRNNISSSDDHVRILQPHGHKRGKSSASFYLDLSSAIIIPYDPTASADVAASSEPSLPVPHGDSRGNGEIKRPELCIHCSSKSSGTHIVDQWHRSDADGEVDLELRL